MTCMYSLGRNRHSFISKYSFRKVLLSRILKGRETQRVTPATEVAIKGPMYFLGENGNQHGRQGFDLRLSSFQSSTSKKEKKRLIQHFFVF